jgi:signal transduction histidine kinase
MNLFSISCLLIVCFTLPMALFIFLKNFNKVNSYWGYFCIITSIYGIGAFKYSNTLVKDAAYFWMQISYIGVIFAPVLFFQFISNFFQLRKKYFIASSYFLAFVFLFLVFFKKQLFFGDLDIIFYEFYSINWWKSRSLVFLIFYISFYWFLLLYAFFYVVKAFINSSGSKRNQLKYFLIAMSIGWLGPHGFFLTHFGLTIYPYSNFLVAVYPLIIGYAIVRYRLMDISLVITRSSIFIAVYSIVLGLPFLFAFGLQDWLKSYLGDMWWLSPLILLTVLATAGPFIYLYIQRRAEEKLFEDQRRYQATLRQAATGMGRIKDMDKLVGLIVHIVTRSVRIEHSVLFLKEPGGKKYVLEGARSRQEANWQIKEVDGKSPLVRMINKIKQPLVYAELHQQSVDNPGLKLDGAVKQMEDLKAELVVPSFIDENLIAFMVLGRKISRELYTSDDIAVFSILASQAALAIENCQFYKDMRATHEQLFQAEKMATIGIMADGLSHQINNRLHALGFIAGDALDTISLKKDIPMADELKEMIVDLEHALSRIQENVTQGGEIVRGLLKYSRKQDEEFSDVELDELIDESLKMAQFKIRKDSMDVIRDFPPGLPKIKGNFAQLQEVFFNLIDNAYDAMMQRKEELKEEGYRPTIEIKAEARANNRMNITLRDNGIGIKAEDQVKIFTPFFTTKLSSKKGTGLGLYVIQKLIEENHKGKVIYKSEYMHGTRVYVTLPVN